MIANPLPRGVILAPVLALPDGPAGAFYNRNARALCAQLRIASCFIVMIHFDNDGREFTGGESWAMAGVRIASKGKRRKPRAGPIDFFVGGKVRQLRLMRGMSQQSLARSLGITFQQLQKNERGINRIGSSWLYELSLVLGVPIQHFFDELPENATARRNGHVVGNTPPDIRHDRAHRLADRETVQLVRAYYRIGDPKIRRQVFHLAKSLALV